MNFSIRLFFLFWLVCLAQSGIQAQNNTIAQFPGGSDAYNRYLRFWTEQRPKECGLEGGQTVVEAKVPLSGMLEQVKVIRSSGCPAFDSICLEAVRAMPRWTPHQVNGEPTESIVEMTIILQRTHKFVKKLLDLKVTFWVPYGKNLAVGPLGNSLELYNFGGLGVAFEGKKWGVEDFICLGRGRVSIPFSYEQKDWPLGQKYRILLVQVGARRVLYRYPTGTLWAVGGIGLTTLTKQDYPSGANIKDYEVSSAAPYLGADWRIFPRFKSFRASPSEYAQIYGQLSFRTFPWAITNVAPGGILSLSAGVGILIGQNSSRAY